MGIEIAALFGFVGTLHGLNTEAKIMPRDWHQAGLPEQMVAGPYPIAVRAIARAPSTQGQAPISPSHPSTVLRPIAKGTEDKLSGITKPLGFHLSRRGAPFYLCPITPSSDASVATWRPNFAINLFSILCSPGLRPDMAVASREK